MNFKKWLKEYNREYRDYMLESAKRQMPNGMIELKDKDTTAFVWSSWDEKSLRLFTAYQNQKTTKKLVRATWSLAIVTIILTIVNLFMK